MKRLMHVLLLLALVQGGQALAEGQDCSDQAARTHLANTLKRLQEMYGIEAAPAPKVRIHSEKLNLSDSRNTPMFGYYHSQSETLHVACNANRNYNLEVSVSHEATHYYLRHAFGELPTWLSEGLATYMEVGNQQADKAEHKINLARLKEFTDLLKHGRVPPLASLLSQNPYRAIPSHYYAGYWALIFSLMHHPDQAIQQERRQLLLAILHNPDRDLLTLNKQLLQGLVKDSNLTLDDWELAWRRQIWDLQ